MSRYPAAGKCFQKTRSPAVRNFEQFSRNSSFNSSKTQDICLEISSDYKYCLGLKLEAFVEAGHRVKSQRFRNENLQVLTHEVNSRWISTAIINETSPEYLVFVQKCQAILNKSFVLLWTNSPRLPLLSAQSSVWNRLSFLNNFLEFLHKVN